MSRVMRVYGERPARSQFGISLHHVDLPGSSDYFDTVVSSLATLIEGGTTTRVGNFCNGEYTLDDASTRRLCFERLNHARDLYQGIGEGDRSRIEFVGDGNGKVSMVVDGKTIRNFSTKDIAFIFLDLIHLNGQPEEEINITEPQ